MWRQYWPRDNDVDIPNPVQDMGDFWFRRRNALVARVQPPATPSSRASSDATASSSSIIVHSTATSTELADTAAAAAAAVTPQIVIPHIVTAITPTFSTLCKRALAGVTDSSGVVHR
jgi:hypothetical protein